MDSLILIGSRDSGKTETGRMLASRASLPLVDADHLFTDLYGGIADFVTSSG